jgi:hypothetical protein
MWSQIPDGSPWLSICDKIEAELPPNLQLTLMFHLYDAGQPTEGLVLDFPQTTLTKTELTTLRTTLSEKYQGKLNFLSQPNNIYVPYFSFPNTSLTPQLKTATPATNSTPLPPQTIPVPALSEKQPSPRKHFNTTYCAVCDEKDLCSQETINLCIKILHLQAQNNQTEVWQKWLNRPKYPKNEPSVERHRLDGISWMSCEGQKGPYEKALEKENVPNDVFAAWKRMLQDAVSAGKKGAVISGTKEGKQVDYWCWLNTYEGEVSICRRPIQTK